MRVLMCYTILEFIGECSVVGSLSNCANQSQAKGEDIVSEISADLNIIFLNDHGIMKRTAFVLHRKKTCA